MHKATFAFVFFLLMLPLAGSQCGGSTDPDDDPQAITTETEPNEGLANAVSIVFDTAGRSRLKGACGASTAGAADADYYSLGALDAGDRVTVDVDVVAAGLQLLTAIFDADGRLSALHDPANDRAADSGFDIDEIIRHDSAGYYLLICPSSSAETTEGSYEVIVTVDRGGTAPSPQPQTVLLNFDGGTIVSSAGTTVVAPFDAGDIDSRYRGQTAIVKQWIIETARQNYARYKVTILNTDQHAPPDDGAYSTVYFGGYDPGGLGMAVAGIDPYNANPSDEAIVFTQRFTPELFTTTPDASRLGVAIGNITAHEVGHLLGLRHVRNVTALMNTYDAPDHLLTDQAFKHAVLDRNVLPVDDLDLGQDADLLLAETVGRAPSAVDVEVTVGTQPTSIAVADFDGDGADDVAVACFQSMELWLLWNDGSAHFPVPGVASGIAVRPVVAADLDRDGTQDIAAGELISGTVVVYLNWGAGQFPWPDSYALGGTPWAIAAADWNRDRYPDLGFVDTSTNDVSIVLNQGNGAFGSAQLVAEGVYPMAIAAGDLDGDNDVDLVFANGGSTQQVGQGGLRVALNRGNGTFDTPFMLAGDAIAYAVAVADLNNDGWQDLALTNRFSIETFSGAAVVLLNEGGATFSAEVLYPVGASPESLAVGDLNGDDAPDLAIGNADSDDVSVLLNNGDGSFAFEWPYRVGDDPSSVALGDFDRDGDLDLAVSNAGDDTVSILLNRGNGFFANR